MAITTEAVQYWEQECPNPLCGRRYRFKREGIWLHVAEFVGPFTEPKPAQQTSPAPKFEVAWRIARQALDQTA